MKVSRRWCYFCENLFSSNLQYTYLNFISADFFTKKHWFLLRRLHLSYWVMRSELYRLTGMTFEMAREAGFFFFFVDFMSCKTIAKRPCYGPLKIKPSYNCSYIWYLLVLILWRPTDSNERWVSDFCNLQRGGRNNLISHILHNFIVVIYREAVEII